MSFNTPLLQTLQWLQIYSSKSRVLTVIHKRPAPPPVWLLPAPPPRSSDSTSHSRLRIVQLSGAVTLANLPFLGYSRKSPNSGPWCCYALAFSSPGWLQALPFTCFCVYAKRHLLICSLPDCPTCNRNTPLPTTIPSTPIPPLSTPLAAFSPYQSKKPNFFFFFLSIVCLSPQRVDFMRIEIRALLFTELFGAWKSAWHIAPRTYLQRNYVNGCKPSHRLPCNIRQ